MNICHTDVLTAFVHSGEQSASSLYFTCTTITTVGYGDVLAQTTNEKVFCFLLMIIGVIGFSFASGSLASILNNYDLHNAKLSEKVETLNKIQKDYDISKELYNRVHNSLKVNYM